MTVTITNNMTLLYDAETTTDWTTDDAVTTYTGFQREGTYCIGLQASQGTAYAYKTVASVNLTNSVIYSWMNSGIVATKANGGFRIVLGDGTNIRAYYVGGSDDYGFRYSSWSCFVLDTSNLPSNYHQILGTAAPDLTAITQVGAEFNVLVKAVGAGDNCFIDICRYISNSSAALTIKGGSPSSPGNFAEIVTEDESTSNAYGIVRELQTGVFGIEGALEIGDSGTLSSYFEDKNVAVIFEDHALPKFYYKITLLGNTVGINSVVFGEEVGGVGINGLSESIGGTFLVYDTDYSNINLNTLNIFGNIFQRGGTIDVGGNTIASFQNVSFNGCAEVQGGTSTFDGCQFNNAPDAAFHMITDVGMGTCSFNANSIGISFAGISAGSTLTLDELTFIGNGFDLYWDGASGTLVVQNLNGSNASTQKCPNGGTIDIQTAVSLTIWVEDQTGNPLDGVRCAIYTPAMVQLMNELTDVNGQAQESYAYIADQDVNVRVRKQGYVPLYQDATITSAGLTMYITLAEDAAYNPT